MAWARLSGTNQASLKSSGTTQTISPTATFADGSAVFVAIGILNTNTGTTFSVSDNSGNGNTWVEVHRNTARNPKFALYACYNAIGITSSTVITATYTVTASVRTIAVFGYSGLLTSATLNAELATSAANGQYSAGTFAGDTNELLIGVVSLNNSSTNGALSPTSPWSLLTSTGTTGGATGSNIYLAVIEQNAPSNTTYTAAGTFASSTSSPWAGGGASFKIDTGGGSTGQIKVYNGSSFVAKPVKAYNGSTWVTKPVKVYNGSAWVVTNY
jgi:hypothetical protein